MHTDLSLGRLFQLISPSLPIGSYTYSQGIEWAVETGWIQTEQDLQQWLNGLLETNILYLELPVFLRMLDAWRQGDEIQLKYWNDYLLASRETHELRQEEINRARAFFRVLVSLHAKAAAHESLLLKTQHACISYACVEWNIDKPQACLGLLYGWLENLVLSAVKIIPLGQTSGQKLIFELNEKLPEIIQQSMNIDDTEIGSSSMAQAIASCQHETQYTRLFRS